MLTYGSTKAKYSTFYFLSKQQLADMQMHWSSHSLWNTHNNELKQNSNSETTDLKVSK